MFSVSVVTGSWPRPTEYVKMMGRWLTPGPNSLWPATNSAEPDRPILLMCTEWISIFFYREWISIGTNHARECDSQPIVVGPSIPPNATASRRVIHSVPPRSSPQQTTTTEMVAMAATAPAPPLRAPPLRAPRSFARTRRGSVICAVASDAAEAPAAPGARLSADCVVVGGGISGLCTAQALATRHGVDDVLVTEARARPGGNITTVERPDEGYLWEEGPNSFQPSDPVLTMAVRTPRSSPLFLFISLERLNAEWAAFASVGGQRTQG
jgi:hypothetical protein